jgi:hypothetical protein
LRALPRETASAGFTARALARLDEVEEAGTPAWFLGLSRITLPAAVLAATTLGVAASVWLHNGSSLAGPRHPLSAMSSPSPMSPIWPISPISPISPATPPMTPVRSGAPVWNAPRAVPVSARSSRQRETRQAAALLEGIQAEHDRLNAELRRLQARPSTVYLGGDEDMDLVVHLDQVRELPHGQIRTVADHQQLD